MMFDFERVEQVRAREHETDGVVRGDERAAAHRAVGDADAAVGGGIDVGVHRRRAGTARLVACKCAGL